MKIALYHNVPTGGSKRVVYEHCRLLRESGHSVVAFEPSTSQVGFLDVQGIVDEVVTVPFEWQELIWGGARHTLRDVSRMYRAYQRLTRMHQQVASLIAQRKFDLVYVHPDTYEGAPSLLRYLSVPTLYFCQEPSRDVFEAPLVVEGEAFTQARDLRGLLLRSIIARKPGLAIRSRFRELDERLNLLSATLLITNSSFSCEAILRVSGRPGFPCRLGVDGEFFHPAGPDREEFVFSAGGYWPQKGFRFLIRSLGRMPQAQRPPLVLAGDRVRPGELEILADLARENEVELKTLVRVSDEELRGLYSRCRIFLYAPYLEPLGLTPLEAMACEAPVLGVREAGIRETVRPGVSGWLVGRDEDEFAAALSDILNGPDEIARLGKAAREYVLAEWTWEHSRVDLLRYLEKALHAPAPPAATRGQR